MTQKPDKAKRRPPGDAPSGGQQDADWGFDAGAGDPAVEKKLGIVLVICLLLGFGFVFFQKYRLLQNENAHAQTNDGANVETGDDSVVREPTSGAKEAEPASHDSPSLTSTPPLQTVPAESPFFEPPAPTATIPPESQSTPTETASWTLTQAENPAASFADSTGDSLPPQPETPPSDRFDPFLDPVESDRSAAPLPESAPRERVADTWGDDSPPAQSEPSPPAKFEPLPAQAEPSPFLTEAADRPELPTSAAPAEPSVEAPTFVFEEASQPAEPAPSHGDDAPTLTFDPLPPQQEPQPLESPDPEASVAGESPSLPARPSSQDSFDPFQTAEPPQAATAVVPQKVIAPPAKEEPFGYIAPPIRDKPAITKAPAAMPAPNPVVEPPAWPFGASANNRESNSAAGTSPDAAEPKAAPSPFDAPLPRNTPSAVTSSSAVDMPPSPFSFDAADSRPITESVVPGHAAIGEREIVVAPSDSFWSISEREYGSARYFNALAKYNRDRVDAPDKLRSGMKIKIPPPEVLEDKHPDLFRTSAVPQAAISPISGSSAAGDETPPAGLFVDERQQPRYRVGEQETLSSIAQQVLGRSSRWTEVYDLNRDQLKSPSTLKIGTVLKLPPDAGRVTVSPAGGFVR